MKRLLLCLMILLSVGVVSAQDEVQWNGTDRFTILIMGMDRRPGEGGELTFRSDTIMLASLDPLHNRIGVLSIPRTIHLALPENGELVAVNTLLIRGELRQEGYGAELTRQVIQHNLGIYIDAYVLVDFDAFIDLVDTVGGIEITLNYNIVDPTYPDMNFGFDPFYLKPGTHILDGYDALRFARTRHQDNDYLRVERQLQVVEAVRERVSDPVIFQYLMTQASTIWSQFVGKIFTDLTLQDAIYLAITSMNISEENIYFGSLNEAYSFYVGTANNSVRVPDRERLPELLTEVFGAEYYQ